MQMHGLSEGAEERTVNKWWQKEKEVLGLSPQWVVGWEGTQRQPLFQTVFVKMKD